jgi:hypothetical protein
MKRLLFSSFAAILIPTVANAQPVVTRTEYSGQMCSTEQALPNNVGLVATPDGS